MTATTTAPVVSPAPAHYNLPAGSLLLTRPGDPRAGVEAVVRGEVRSFALALTLDPDQVVMALTLAVDLRQDASATEIASAILTVHDRHGADVILTGARLARTAAHLAATGQRPTPDQRRAYRHYWPDPTRTAACRALAARLACSVGA